MDDFCRWCGTARNKGDRACRSCGRPYRVEPTSIKARTPGTRKVLSVVLVVGIVAVAILLVVGGLGLVRAGA
jgi:uncharacterized membrane protein YvbJ